jgi:hypothetical protein
MTGFDSWQGFFSLFATTFRPALGHPASYPMDMSGQFLRSIADGT